MPLDVVRRRLLPLRERVVTSRYPAEPPLLQSGSHGLPEVDPARCNRDGACITACPTSAISVADATWSIDAGRCVFCSACALACPEGAIRMGARVELAARQRDGLVVVTQLRDRP